jgi:hypothetical protein
MSWIINSSLIITLQLLSSCTLPSCIKNRTHFSKWSVPALRWKGSKTPMHLGLSETAAIFSYQTQPGIQ